MEHPGNWRKPLKDLLESFQNQNQRQLPLALY
jgi:hypothetical protein